MTTTIVPKGSTAERGKPRIPFGAPHVFVLVTVEGTDISSIHRLAQPETVIGRDETADFHIADGEISKEHVRIRVDGPVCTIMDLDSTNGTLLNGKQLRSRVSQRVRHLDEIAIGGTRLLILSGRFKRSADRRSSGG